MYGLTVIILPEPGIKSGKFGKSGKMIIAPYSIDPEKRSIILKEFLKFIDIKICGCWEWKGRIHNGYASFHVPGDSSRWAHRVSYALFNGPIKAQKHIDHICRNKKCVRPDHLKQVAPIENYLAVHRRKLRDIKKMREDAGQLLLWG